MRRRIPSFLVAALAVALLILAAHNSPTRLAADEPKDEPSDHVLRDERCLRHAYNAAFSPFGAKTNLTLRLGRGVNDY
jgi:hypothetical protein